MGLRLGTHATAVDVVDGWRYCEGDEYPDPDSWMPCGSARTVAHALKAVAAAGGGQSDEFPVGVDERSHWFSVDVLCSNDEAPQEQATVLFVSGVATIAEFYWNDVLVGSSTSMFSEHTIDVSAHVQPGFNKLVVRCLSLTSWISELKLPRTRWKTRLVEEQKLRGVRTTLLGRATGWSPPTTVVGVWGDVVVVQTNQPIARAPEMRATVAGQIGAVEGSIDLLVPVGYEPVSATYSLSCDGHEIARSNLDLSRSAPNAQASEPCGFDDWTVKGRLEFRDPNLWWPHTHGEPNLYLASLQVEDAQGRTTELGLGPIGFRSVAVDHDTDGEGFGLVINGVATFCRGGTLFPLDSTTFCDDAAALRERLLLVRDGGHNMVRISGTVGYGSDTLYRICAELGLLVWQDLPFANFDYPSDESFLSTIRDEVRSFLRRVAMSPALCVIAGSSEVQQQAAMMGLAVQEATASAHTTVCAELISQVAPNLVFVESSPSGGHVPFAVDTGISHYFGVGAYRRPLTDARHARVRFAAECLALSNVPTPHSVRSLISEGLPTPINPMWKQRVPRDRGTGWDFEDIRDFYARELFGVDPNDVRYSDADRYLAIGRATSCAVFEHTLAEWRRPASTCRGALVWTLNDLWAGAGWGLIDSSGRPKAAYFGARRSLSPIAVVCVDEGLNGLDLHLYNDGAAAIGGSLRVYAVRGGSQIYSVEVAASVPGHGSRRFRVDEVLGRFTDPTYAYAFGPRSIDAVAASWFSADGVLLGRAVFVPAGERLTVDSALEIKGQARWVSDTELAMSFSSNRLARFVTVDLGQTIAVASDDHFSLVPHDEPYEVRYRIAGGPMPKRLFVSALNADGETAVTIATPGREP